jgi:hypothetical protein
MPDMNREQLHTLARLGAQARLMQLDAEIAAIRAAYPESTEQPAGRGRKPGRKPAVATMPVEKPAAKPRKRYRMSAEAKKIVSERMKRYWAERRKAKEHPAPAAAVEAADVKAPKPRGGKQRKMAKRGRQVKK